MDIESWVATYAAIVATGALTLEVRRWFETGPRIKLRVQPNMVMANGMGAEQTRLVLVTVRNRGTLATTITTVAMVKYPNRFCRYLRTRGSHFIIPRPNLGNPATSIPHLLEPGTQWIGMIQKKGGEVSNFEDGTVVIEVYTSDRDRAYRKAIRRNANKTPTDLEDT